MRAGGTAGWSGRGGLGRRAAWWAAIAATVIVTAAGPVRASEVEIGLAKGHGACEVHGSFTAAVSRDVAWDVLTDYESIGRFVTSVKASHLERQPDGKVLLRQDAVGGVFMFRRRMQVLLVLNETPRERIAFHDVAVKDFRSYSGEWRVSRDSVGTRVDYQLAAEPRAAVARALCRGALRGSARELLDQVRAEMLRRGADATEP